MPTPDEVFEQVLAEEQAKGSSPAVAQARAKAARVRAQRGAKDPNKPDPSTAQGTARGAEETAPAAAASEQPVAATTEQPAAGGASQEPAARPSPAARPAAKPAGASRSGGPARRGGGEGARGRAP